MGLINKTLTVVSIGAFLLYIVQLASTLLDLFYPTLNIPLVHPHPQPTDPEQVHRLAWEPGYEFQLSVYVSPRRTVTARTSDEFFETALLVWQSEIYALGNKRGARSQHQDAAGRSADGELPLMYTYDHHPRVDHTIEVELSDEFRAQNGSMLYAHAFVHNRRSVSWRMLPMAAGGSERVKAINFGDSQTLYAVTPLIRYMPKRVDRERHLLKGQPGDDNMDLTAGEGRTGGEAWVAHGKSRVAWEIVLEDHQFPLWKFPVDIAPFVRILKSSSNAQREGGPAPRYLPLFWENPLCTRRDDYYPLTNKTDGEGVDSALEAKSFPLRIQFNAVKLGWLRLSNQLNYVFKQFASPGSAIKFSEKELDGLRHTFFEVNPTLVFVTVMASLLHILFEFLAYKEDIAFWASGGKREDKDGGSGDAFEGISRTFVWMSLIGSWCSVFYVWDQKSDTSVIVLGGAVVRAVVETWKIKKLLMLPKGGDAVVDTSSNGKEALPAERGEGGANLASSAKRIKEVQEEVDQQTVWYMTHLCIPAMVAYAAFSLMYMKHKSAFSWFVHVLLATIYLLEFVQMWPQLIINHKLKTVDTLPLSAFCYRFLTTFIDDLFALVIPMPLLTRLGTFRDDIVFLVLCWQWWAYPKRKQATEDGKKGGPAGKDPVAATAEKAGDEGTTPDAAHSDGGRRDEKSGL